MINLSISEQAFYNKTDNGKTIKNTPAVVFADSSSSSSSPSTILKTPVQKTFYKSKNTPPAFKIRKITERKTPRKRQQGTETKDEPKQRTKTKGSGEEQDKRKKKQQQMKWK